MEAKRSDFGSKISIFPVHEDQPETALINFDAKTGAGINQLSICNGQINDWNGARCTRTLKTPSAVLEVKKRYKKWICLRLWVDFYLQPDFLFDEVEK